MGEGEPEQGSLSPEDPQPPVRVVPVDASQAKAAGDAAARGFQENEIWQWILLNYRTRARVEKRQYRSLVKRVVAPRGSAWMSLRPDDSGHAGRRRPLVPPGTMNLTWKEAIAEAVPFMPEGLPRLGMVGRLETEMKKHHPKQPHWYLSVLFRSNCRSQGLGHGSALMRPGLERADAAGGGPAGDPAPGQRRLLRALRLRAGQQIMIDGELPIWLMWREPQRL